MAFGNVDELNAFSFFNLNYKVDKWTFNPGLRLDYFTYDYPDLLTETYDSKSENNNPESQAFSHKSYFMRRRDTFL